MKTYTTGRFRSVSQVWHYWAVRDDWHRLWLPSRDDCIRFQLIRNIFLFVIPGEIRPVKSMNCVLSTFSLTGCRQSRRRASRDRAGRGLRLMSFASGCAIGVWKSSTRGVRRNRRKVFVRESVQIRLESIGKPVSTKMDSNTTGLTAYRCDVALRLVALSVTAVRENSHSTIANMQIRPQ